ncbi:MAG: hypothetical protein ACI9CE_003670, partial [Flavobacterium sp.]
KLAKDKPNYKRLYDSAMEIAVQGLTTLEEVVRVTGQLEGDGGQKTRLEKKCRAVKLNSWLL